MFLPMPKQRKERRSLRARKLLKTDHAADDKFDG
jgi:hypothetical protein